MQSPRLSSSAGPWAARSRSEPLRRVTCRIGALRLLALALAMACEPAPEAPPGAARDTAPAPREAARLDTIPPATTPDTQGPLAFVSNEDSDDVTVIDTATDSVVATVPVGQRPRGIRVSPDGSRVYVAVSGSPKAPPGIDEETLPPPDRAQDGIAVVEVATLKRVAKLPSGPDPEQFAIHPDGSRIYISNEDAHTATVLDVESSEVLATVPVGVEPEGVAISPDGRWVYVSAETDHDITVIDTETNEAVGKFGVGERPRAIEFSPDGSRAYVTGELGADVSVVDVSRHEVIATIPIETKGAKPMGVEVSPDGQQLYVANGRGGDVAVIDPAAGKVVESIQVGERPWEMALTPDGRKLYTANGPSNDVSVIDTERLEVVTTIPAGKSPWGVAIGG